MITYKTILVMDDDPRTCQALEMVVRTHGYMMECARSCADAIRRLRHREYAGLILDEWLERSESEDVIAWLRREGRDEPVVMMSDAADDELWVEVLSRGAADLIAKPLHQPVVDRAFRLAFDRKPATAAN